MTIARQDHEEHSAFLAMPVLDRVLKQVYPRDVARHVTVRSLAIEGIVGHMATRRIHSVEAGVVLVADGCRCGARGEPHPHDHQRGVAPWRHPQVLRQRHRPGDDRQG